MGETQRIPERRQTPRYEPLKSAAKAGTAAIFTWLGIVATVILALFAEPSFVQQLKEVIGDNKTWLAVLTLLQMAFVFWRDKQKHDTPPAVVEVPLKGPWTPPTVDRKDFLREEYAAAKLLHGRRVTCPDSECQCVLPKRISRKTKVVDPPAPGPAEV